VPSELPSDEPIKKSVNVVPIAVGGIVGGVVLIAAAGLFAWLRRRSLRRASDSTHKLTTPPCTEPGASLDQSDASNAVRLPTQESPSGIESGSQAPMASASAARIQHGEILTAPAQPGSNTVRLEILDLEPDEIAAASTSRLSSRIKASSSVRSTLEDVQEFRNSTVSPRGVGSWVHPRTPTTTQTSTRPTAMAVHTFPKDKLADMLMEESETELNISAKPTLIDTSDCFEILPAEQDVPMASNSGQDQKMDDRARAREALRKLREDGLLVKTEANLVLLQQGKEEATSGTVGLVASRVAGRRMEASEPAAGRRMEASDPPASPSTCGEDDQLSFRSESSATCSLPGVVALPKLHNTAKMRPPPLGAWTDSAKTLDSASPASVRAPVEPASPTLVDGGPPTPASGNGPTQLAQKHMCKKRAEA